MLQNLFWDPGVVAKFMNTLSQQEWEHFLGSTSTHPCMETSGVMRKNATEVRTRVSDGKPVFPECASNTGSEITGFLEGSQEGQSYLNQ